MQQAHHAQSTCASAVCVRLLLWLSSLNRPSSPRLAFCRCPAEEACLGGGQPPVGQRRQLPTHVPGVNRVLMQPLAVNARQALQAGRDKRCKKGDGSHMQFYAAAALTQVPTL